tara:strand:- start:265 stop:732 length:468 start_codon:yes stop_codon:yes gene_type:complete
MDLAFFARKAGVKVMLIESCSGGFASSYITSLTGSSSWFEGGVVSYSNKMKQDFLGVNEKVICDFGAVSEEVAAEMVSLPKYSKTNDVVSASITGIAGPGGGSKEKPVGLVCFGWAGSWGVITRVKKFAGNRNQIREQAAFYSITCLAKEISFIL